MSSPRRDPLAAFGGPAAPRPSRGPRNFHSTIITNTAAENALRPLQEGGCPPVRG